MAELKEGENASLEDVSEAMDEPIAVVPPKEEVVETDPFGNSKRFELESGEVNLTQLQDEIAEHVGHAVSASVMRKDDGTGVLWVAPGDTIDGRKVRGVINRHEPDPDYGISEPEKTRREIVAKIRRGEKLDADEVTEALRLMLDPQRPE